MQKDRREWELYLSSPSMRTGTGSLVASTKLMNDGRTTESRPWLDGHQIFAIQIPGVPVPKPALESRDFLSQVCPAELAGAADAHDHKALTHAIPSDALAEAMGYVILLPTPEPRGARGVDVHIQGHCEMSAPSSPT